MDEKFNRDDDFFKRAMESERNVNGSKDHTENDSESMLKQRFAKSLMGISGLYSTGKFCKSCDAIADEIIEDLTEKLDDYKKVKDNTAANTMAYERTRHCLITEIVVAAQKLDYYKIMSLASSFSSLASALGDDEEEKVQENIKRIIDNYGTYPKDWDVKDDD